MNANKTYTYAREEEKEPSVGETENELCYHHYLKQIHESSDESKADSVMKNDKISYLLTYHQNHHLLTAQANKSRNDDIIDSSSLNEQKCKHFLNLNLN